MGILGTHEIFAVLRFLHSIDWYFVTDILGQPIKADLHCMKSQKSEEARN
jgi:hypothetical protein